jgi:hypothetical protein
MFSEIQLFYFGHLSSEHSVVFHFLCIIKLTVGAMSPRAQYAVCIRHTENDSNFDQLYHEYKTTNNIPSYLHIYYYYHALIRPQFFAFPSHKGTDRSAPLFVYFIYLLIVSQ